MSDGHLTSPWEGLGHFFPSHSNIWRVELCSHLGWDLQVVYRSLALRCSVSEEEEGRIFFPSVLPLEVRSCASLAEGDWPSSHLGPMWVLQRVLRGLPHAQLPDMAQPLSHSTTWKLQTCHHLYHIPGFLPFLGLYSCVYFKVLTLYPDTHYMKGIPSSTCVSCLRHFLPRDAFKHYNTKVLSSSMPTCLG